MSLKQNLAAAAVAVTSVLGLETAANAAECDANWVNPSAVSKVLFVAPVETWQTQEIAKLGSSTLAQIFKDTEKLPRTLSRDVDSVFKPLERAVEKGQEIKWDDAKKDAHVSFAAVLDQVQAGQLSIQEGREKASIAATEYTALAQKTLNGIQGQTVPCLVVAPAAAVATPATP